MAMGWWADRSRRRTERSIETARQAFERAAQAAGPHEEGEHSLLAAVSADESARVAFKGLRTVERAQQTLAGLGLPPQAAIAKFRGGYEKRLTKLVEAIDGEQPGCEPAQAQGEPERAVLSPPGAEGPGADRGRRACWASHSASGGVSERRALA